MANVELIGFPQSTYVWSVRIALEEKGVSYMLQAKVDVRSEAYAREYHPFKKVPAFRHGDVKLFEALAILHYVEEVFEGPALVPADTLGRARMYQWISAASDYLYDSAIRKLALPRLVAPGSMSEEAIAANRPILRAHLEVFDAALGQGTWLAGEQFSLADCVLTPIVSVLGLLPEGKQALDALGNLARFVEQAQARPSFAASAPPMGG